MQILLWKPFESIRVCGAKFLMQGLHLFHYLDIYVYSIFLNLKVACKNAETKAG